MQWKHSSQTNNLLFFHAEVLGKDRKVLGLSGLFCRSQRDTMHPAIAHFEIP